MKKDIAHSPTFGDILSHFVFDKPIVDPTLHAWIAFIRSCIIFLLVDIITFVVDAFTHGEVLNTALYTVVLGPQVLYIITRIFQRVAAATDSPLSPLLMAAANAGVTAIGSILATRNVKPPDVGGLPDIEIPPGGTPVQKEGPA